MYVCAHSQEDLVVRPLACTSASRVWGLKSNFGLDLGFQRQAEAQAFLRITAIKDHGMQPWAHCLAFRLQGPDHLNPINRDAIFQGMGSKIELGCCGTEPGARTDAREPAMSDWQQPESDSSATSAAVGQLLPQQHCPTAAEGGQGRLSGCCSRRQTKEIVHM